MPLARGCRSRPFIRAWQAAFASGHASRAKSKLPQNNRETPPMPIIDSQVHAYEANTPKRPWHSVPNWPAHVTGDEMVAAMDKVGVDGAIFISAFSMYQYDEKAEMKIAPSTP